MKTINEIELADKLAHDRLIIENKELYDNDEEAYILIDGELRYKEEYQDQFNNYYDYYYDMIVKCNDNSLLDTLKQKSKELMKIINDRAIEYIEIGEELDYCDLFDIDCDKYPVSLYDLEDMNNHHYDLGAYYKLNEIINILKKEL